MPIAKNSGGDFTPLPAGSHVARCFACISLGTQNSPMYPPSFKVMLMFEVPGEAVEIEGKSTPMTISREYTLSLNEKANLRHDLEAWRAKQFKPEELEGFQVADVVGHPCMLNVIHKTTAKKKVYGAISSIGGLPKGVQCPPQWHKTVKYEIEEGENETFKAFPKWIQNKISACNEWSNDASVAESAAAPTEPPTASDANSDEPPF